MKRARALVPCGVAFAALVLAVTPLLGCYGPARPTPATLRVSAEPATARVLLDEAFIGPARRLAAQPKSLAPGRYRLTITAPGFFPHDLELELPSGETHVEISLRPIPP